MGTHCNQTAGSLPSEMEVCMLAEDEHNDWMQYNQVTGVVSAWILRENSHILGKKPHSFSLFQEWHEKSLAV